MGKFRPGIIYISWSEIGGWFTWEVKSFWDSFLFLQNVNIRTDQFVLMPCWHKLMLLWLCANGEFVRGVHLILAACLLWTLCLSALHTSLTAPSQLCIPALGHSCHIYPCSCLLHTFFGTTSPLFPSCCPLRCSLPGIQLLFQLGRNLWIDFCAALINIYVH